MTARYIFFAALVCAPWFYGGTTATSILVINWLLGLAVVLWIVELLINRRWPKLPKLPVLVALVLLLFGAWMTINARSIYDAEFGTFALIKNVAPGAPGSLDYAISAAWTIAKGYRSRGNIVADANFWLRKYFLRDLLLSR